MTLEISDVEIDIAVQWWVDCLRRCWRYMGDTVAMMCGEAGWRAVDDGSAREYVPTEPALKAFANHLAYYVRRMPRSNSIVLSTDYHPRRPLLDAARLAGLDEGVFPWKVSVRIEPQYVTAHIVDDAALVLHDVRPRAARFAEQLQMARYRKDVTGSPRIFITWCDEPTPGGNYLRAALQDEDDRGVELPVPLLGLVELSDQNPELSERAAAEAAVRRALERLDDAALKQPDRYHDWMAARGLA